MVVSLIQIVKIIDNIKHKVPTTIASLKYQIKPENRLFSLSILIDRLLSDWSIRVKAIHWKLINIEIIVPRRLPSSCSDVSSGRVKFSKNKKYRNIKKVHIIAYVRT